MKNTWIIALVGAAGMLGACSSDDTASTTRTASGDWYRNNDRTPTTNPIPSTFDPAPRVVDSTPTRNIDGSVTRTDATGRVTSSNDPAYRNDPYKTNPSQPMPNNRQSADTMGMSSPDVRILSVLHMKNAKEIELGKLAQQNGSSDDVKKFGEMLVRDHSACEQKVQSAAKSAGITLLSDEQTRQVLANERVSGGPMPGTDPAAELRGLQGSDFDRAFGQKMLDGHRMLIQTVEKAQGEVRNDKVSQLLRDTLPKLREHEQMAMRITGGQTNSPK